MKAGKYWIFTTITECLWCGNSYEVKQRRYTKKPKDRNDRIKWIHRYDYCSSL